MIEYNIAKILSIEKFEKETKKVFSEDDFEIIKEKINIKFEKLSSLTFGELASSVKASKYLKQIDTVKLCDIKKYRNYLAHNCFKEKLLNNELSTLDEVDNFINELNNYEVQAVEINEALLRIFKAKRIKQIILDKRTPTLTNSL